MKSHLKEKYSGWGRGGEKHEPSEFQGKSNRGDDFVTDNSLVEAFPSKYSHHHKPQGIMRSSIYQGSSMVGPSTDLRVRFSSPRQQRIEEEIEYHSYELKNLAMELDAVNNAQNVHWQGTGYNNRGTGQSYPDRSYSAGEDSSTSTLLSHDAFSVEALIDHAKPKTTSKWKRSGSPFRARDRSKSPGRSQSAARNPYRGRSKSEAMRDRQRGRSPGRAEGGDRRHVHYGL